VLEIAIVLGVVEGLTEFLPVSSTGHLILVGHWMGFSGAAAATFEIVIQLGAILAVVWEYRQQLLGHARTLGEPSSRRFWMNLVLAFLPAAGLGLVFHEAIKEHLFNPRNVAWALIVGALAIFAVELLRLRPRSRSIEAVTARQALGIGVAQCAALFPGFSRAGATILGGLVVGLDRPTSAEFSFLLAIPTILGATVLDLASSLGGLTPADLAWMGVGLLVSFGSAWAAVRWFLRYVSHHSLAVFAAYRLLVGLLVLGLVGS
jgi:undecaprenyl-diphosphatase